MRYYDYLWDLNPDQIILDPDLDIDKIGWKGGDVFKLINVNGRAILRRIDPVQAFLEGKSING